MKLRTLPKRATLSYTADKKNSQSELYLDCSPMDASFALEIGDRHVWGRRGASAIIGRRRSCNLQVELRRRNSLTQEDIDVTKLSESKIGNLHFCPPEKGHILFQRERAAFYATVFVSDQLFDSLARALEAGKRPMWLDLEIEKKDVLEYGWEPDGSRGVWKLESATEPSSVDVVQMDIGTVLFMPMWKRWIVSVLRILN